MTYKLTYTMGGKTIVFSLTSGFPLGKTVGLTANTIKTFNTQGINQVGGTLQGQSVQPRIITCSGTILGNSREKKERLLSTILPEKIATLTYNDEWEIEVVPKITPDISAHAHNATFEFVLEAAYPYWRKADSSIAKMSYMQPRFKFPWNLTKPWVFAERIAPEFTNVVNRGNVASEFTVVFIATTEALNPYVMKAATQETIKVNRRMAAGEMVRVENTPNYIKATSTRGGVEEDIFNDIDFDSVFFLLDPGDNVLRFDAESNREGVDVHIIYSTTSTGVY